MEKRGKMEKDAQIMIKMLPQQVEYEKKMKAATIKSKAVSKASNQLGRSMHKAVQFDHTEGEGNFVKVNQKVKVGEEVLVERPLCATLNENFSKSHCQTCFIK